MPSPYGRQRDRRTRARSEIRAKDSATRRLFPTPGAPITAALPGFPVAATRSKVATRVSNSRSRPTNGAIGGRTTDSPSINASKRTTGDCGVPVVSSDSGSVDTIERTSRSVSGTMTTSPGAAWAARRDATWTGAPDIAERSEPCATARTSPVARLTLKRSGSGSPVDPGDAVSSDAARTARSASSSRATTSPNTAVTPLGSATIDGAAMPLDRATDDVHGPTSDRLENLRVQRVLVARVNTLGTQHGDDPAVSPLARPGRDRHVPRSRRLLGQNRLLQSLQLRAWIKTQLVGQVPPGVLVGLERFALPPVAIQREHEQAPQPFASGMLADVPAELGDGVPTQTDVDPQLVQLLDRLQAELLEPSAS